jgi:hypothetical protein
VRSGALARGVGIYGCILGATTVIALLSGQMDRHPHIFGMVVVGQVVWFLIVGASLCRDRRPAIPELGYQEPRP